MLFDTSLLNDDTLNAIHKTLAERNAQINGVGGELLGKELSDEWQKRYPGTLPPHLAGKEKPACYRGPGANKPVMLPGVDPAQDPSGQVKAAEPRTISAIAKEIGADWSKAKGGVYYAAKPYLDAMLGVEKLSDTYGQDSAESLVRYFLGNAGRWRGEVAKRVKAELNAMLKARA